MLDPLHSYTGVGQPASIALAFPLSFSKRLLITACSSLTDLALRESASALIRVLSKGSLSFLRAVASLSSPPRASASSIVNKSLENTCRLRAFHQVRS